MRGVGPGQDSPPGTGNGGAARAERERQKPDAKKGGSLSPGNSFSLRGDASCLSGNQPQTARAHPDAGAAPRRTGRRQSGTTVGNRGTQADGSSLAGKREASAGTLRRGEADARKPAKPFTPRPARAGRRTKTDQPRVAR